MEETVRKELDVLKGMVAAWRDSYQEGGAADGSADYLVHEFVEEIEIHVYPYARRLWECQHLSQAEADEFLEFCDRQVEELRSHLKLPTR